MISHKMQNLVKNSSVIRAMFEEGNRLAKLYGPENVFDFSIGNPSVTPPEQIRTAITDILNEENPLTVHGYMNNSGYEDVRQTIAEHINHQHGTAFSAQNIVMTCGAAGGLNVILKTLLNPEDDVIVFAPFFSEYTNYVQNFDGKLVIVNTDPETFLPDLTALKAAITNKTKAIILNTPNNPTGVVYPAELLSQMEQVLTEKEQELSTSIYVISDEPYREIVYDGVTVPFILHYFHNGFIGYSYSKSLSLPGERIGYLVIPDEADGSEELISAATIANRTLGCVNAPSLIQKVVAKCVDAKTDLAAYDKNRQALYNGLKECGFECIKPQGAFYLFVKSPVADEKAFCEAGKKYNILMVPGSSFACPGYVRLAYCVSYDTIVNSLPEFKKLAAEYGLK